MTSRHDYVIAAKICEAAGMKSCAMLLREYAEKMNWYESYPDDGFKDDFNPDPMQDEDDSSSSTSSLSTESSPSSPSSTTSTSTGEEFVDDDSEYEYDDSESYSESYSELSTSISPLPIVVSGRQVPLPPASPPPRDAFNLNRHFDLE